MRRQFQVLRINPWHGRDAREVTITTCSTCKALVLESDYEDHKRAAHPEK